MPPLPRLIDDAAQRLPPGPLCLGFSGGLDSTVLLHLLASIPSIRERGLRAWHVHHGLHGHADAWAEQCEAVCAALSVPLTVSQVAVPRDSGLGLEGAARQARRAVFTEGLEAGEVLALAHHRDDQAETFLLRALRASGPDGLAAMRAWSDFGRGHLWRPLLEVPRAALQDYAAAHGLQWIDDPSNADEAFDRNFLRGRVLPLLAERWPHAVAAIAGSATLCSEAATLLAAEDARLLDDVTEVPGSSTLSRSRLMALPSARRARVLRRWIAALGLPPLPAGGVTQIGSTVLQARADAAARFEWAGAAVRAWRDRLHGGPLRPPLPEGWQVHWDGGAPLPLPDGGTLLLRVSVGAASAEIGESFACAGSTIAAEAAPTTARSDAGDGHSSPGLSFTGCTSSGAVFRPPVIVHARRGGERITLPGRGHSHALKHVLQDAGIPPWDRTRLPLLSTADGELLAAGDRIASAGFRRWLQNKNLRLEWRQASHGAPGCTERFSLPAPR